MARRVYEVLRRERLGSRRWRLDNLYQVVDREGRPARFRMNETQRRLFDGMHHMNVVLKARQLGVTTFVQLFMLDACLFNSNVRAGTIAHRLEDAEAIFRDKVKFAYDQLPEALRRAVPAEQDSARSLRFANNSELRVGTSLRGGTFQYLHVSEYGKICAQFPEQAREIRTGALNTVAPGQIVFIESTAEGREGDFYEICQRAAGQARRGEALSPLDFRFFFFPWWEEPGYRAEAGRRDEPAPLRGYFARLEAEHGIRLSPEQRAWYAAKAESQGPEMKREFPSTPEEAFETAVEGAYYAGPLARAEADGRVGRVPHEPQLKVETWWDLGVDDATAIWFVQRAGRELRLIDYHEASGEGLPHYAGVLQARAMEHGYVYGQHVAPHDIRVRELGSGRSRLETARELGIGFTVCPQHRLADGIEAVRNMLARCWFDAGRCAQGLAALRSYRKEWDDRLGGWKAQPRHDWASHAADALRTGAVGAAEGVGHWGPAPLPAIGGIA